MRPALLTTAAALAALSLACAPAGAATKTASTGYAGKTSDGLPISFRLVTTTTTKVVGSKPKKIRRTVTKQVVGMTVRVNSFCTQSGPRSFVARGGFGNLRSDGSFTARGGGVAVRGKLAAGQFQGTVNEFQRFGGDVCRGAVFFVAS
jgi:hypothetical protein